MVKIIKKGEDTILDYSDVFPEEWPEEGMRWICIEEFEEDENGNFKKTEEYDIEIEDQDRNLSI